MHRDTDRCYRAVASRDPRFDGRFVTAVRTTGIYCRPSCPAVTPKRGNVEFFPTSAAAQLRGYRACRRCLPDAVPGSPDWDTRADLAARAMRLITDGVVDRYGVTGLAARLGYSPRQLHRVLVAQLGAGALALARAQRAHTARLLIEATPTPLVEVAFAAGFASLRQFNDTIRAVYGTTPSRLRAGRSSRADPATTGAGTVHLRLPFRPPLDAPGLFGFLTARAVPGVEYADATGYARTLTLPHGSGTVTLRPAERSVAATLRLTDPRDLAPGVSRVRRLLDLDADPVAVDQTLGTDPALAARVLRNSGVRVPGSVDGAETLVRALLGQQVSVRAARTMATRLAERLGQPLPDGLATPGLTTLFPTPAAVAEHAGTVLRGPAHRLAALRAAATALADGTLVLDPGRDPAEMRAELTALRGVGPWTAGYLSMRVLGTPDELLTTDAVLRRGAAVLGLPTGTEELLHRSRCWRPWRSYAGIHLWNAAATGPHTHRRIA